jgi:uncharacterized protein
MASKTSLLGLIGVGVAVLVSGHYYLWARLIRDIGFSRQVQWGLTSLLCLLAVSIPLAVVASRRALPAWAVAWVNSVYVWIGASFLVVGSTAVVDVLQLGYAFVTSRIESASVAPPQSFARWGGFVALAIGFGVSVYAIREGRQLRVQLVEVPLRKLPKALDGLRIVQLSDVHVGTTTGRNVIKDIVAKVNALAPDVVAITGDLVDGSVADLRHHVAPLADLRSKHGSYFITGNHEYHAGAVAWCQHLSELGVRVLRNEHVALECDGHVIHLAGIDDYEGSDFGFGHGANLETAVAGRDERCPLVLLAHQPKAVHEAVQHGVDLQLSGHTHGGQLWPLGWLQRLGQPVVAGLARFGETFLYVSCGAGSAGPPMRLAAPAEIGLVVLRSDYAPLCSA